MSRNGSFLSLARAMNCGTFSIVPISINILNAPSLAPPCAGPQRHANSLIPRFNSLLEFKKFPVRLRREFACKPLNLLIDWHKNRTERQETANFPVNFPVSREFASQTGSPLTVSSASHSYNLRLGAVSEDSAVLSEALRPAWRLRDAL